MAGSMTTRPGFRAEMDKNGLAMPTGHFSIDMLENDFDGVRKLADTLGVTDADLPAYRGRRAAGRCRRLARLRRAARRRRRKGQAGRLRLCLAQPRFRVQEACRRLGAAGAYPVVGARHRLGDGPRLAGARRRRSARLDRAVRQAHRGGSRQGYRQAGPGPRRGRLGRCRPWHDRLGGDDQGASGQVARPSTSSWNTTTRTISSASPAVRSTPSNHTRRHFRSSPMARKLGVGIVGCGNISAAYFSLAPLFKGIEVQGLRRHQSCGGESPRQGIRRARRNRRRPDAGRRRRHRRQPHRSRRALRDLAAGARRRQACLFRKAVRARRQGRARPEEARRQKGLRVGSAPDTFLGGCAPAGAPPDRQRRRRPHHQRHLLRDEPWHGALASQPGLLLPAGRRTGARRRPLLHHQPDPADRAGEARGGADRRRRAPSARSPTARATARRCRSRRRRRSMA